MKMYYITLNNEDEARAIGYALLERSLAVCVNWFPITCAYRWQGEIRSESEIVLIAKTQDGKRDVIESVIAEHVSYTNLIAEIDVHSVNHRFLSWLDSELPHL